MPRAVHITSALLVCLLLVPAAARAQEPLLSDSFSAPDGLITNEYAYWNPGDSAAHRSAAWEMDSGSLFARAGAGWTGPVTDNCDPDRDSATCTNSGVFRLNTKRRDFDAVHVDMRLRANAFDNRDESADPDTPAVAWDGVHVWLHYVDQYELYYASVNRRDGSVVVKKKCRGGADNGGTYYELAAASGYPVPMGAWQHVGASIRTNADQTVTIKLYREGQQLIEATDTGVGCAAIAGPGAVGVRGDNLDFDIDDFTVSALAAEPEARPDPTPRLPPDPVIGQPPTPSTQPTQPRPQPTPTTQPPQSTPVNETPHVTLRAAKAFRSTLVLRAGASDDRAVRQVRFYLDGRRVATDRKRPFRFTYRPNRRLRAGKHTVWAVAVDTSGATKRSRRMTVRYLGRR
jgi:Bacterial Ig domain